LSKFIPYGHQCIDKDDIRAVVEVLRSDWITTGPAVDAFEKAVDEFVGAEYGTAVSSGTAALHTAVYGCGIKPGDEVIVPAMTFAATANAVVFQGATPVFCDVDADTLLIDPDLVEAKINPRTKAIITVDYAGQPCDYVGCVELQTEIIWYWLPMRVIPWVLHTRGGKSVH
jgi:perosamine synthetase